MPNPENLINGPGAYLAINNSILSSTRDIQVNVNTYSTTESVEQLIKQHSVPAAAFDSRERYDPPKCHPETRKAILEQIERWAGGGSRGEVHPILWLRGAAGAGKSAIAQTISERLHEKGTLAGSFYFSRTAAKRNVNQHFVATLVHQLWCSIPASQTHIMEAIKREPGIFDKTLEAQMIKLFVQPFIAIASSEAPSRTIVVIDGLDECSLGPPEQFEVQQKEILRCILLALKYPNFPVRFLIASRPEYQIRESFEHSELSNMTSPIHLTQSPESDADIEIFLEAKFAELRGKYTFLPSSWPGKSTIQSLVRTSSGHFIYAFTSMRYIMDPRKDPQQALDTILNIRSSIPDRENPLQDLDALYGHILDSVSEASVEPVRTVLQALVFTSSDREFGKRVKSLENLEEIFFLSKCRLSPHLIDLHSILDVPSQADSAITFIHASFPDFLMNRHRSKQHHIDELTARVHLLLRYLEYLRLHHISRSLQHELWYPVRLQAWAISDILQGDRRDIPRFLSLLSQDGGSPAKLLQAFEEIGRLRAGREIWYPGLILFKVCNKAEPSATKRWARSVHHHILDLLATFTVLRRIYP